jgi:iron complex outermembrane receptor protein
VTQLSQIQNRAAALRATHRVVAGVCLVLASATALVAQGDTVRVPTTIDEVRVRIARDAERSVLDLPFAISRVSPDSLRPQLRRANVGDLLFAIPGVQVQTRNNPTQDARIAVRGFGARSAFGVRGVKVLRDGIPITLPDGQTPMDWLDLESVGSVEAIRGTAAALYGNAAGGVLDFRTRDAATTPAAAHVRVWDGGGARRAQALASGTIESARGPSRTWLASVAHTRTDGPRVYARQEATSAFVRGEGTVGGARIRLYGSAFDMPLAENPGALTAAELARDVRLADSQSVARGASKTVRHAQLGMSAEQGTADDGLAIAAWAGARELDNPLPFAVVSVDRRNLGMWVRGTSTSQLRGLTARMSAGIDIQSVNDDRRNFENCVAQNTSARCPTAGSDRGTLRLDQREVVQSEGAFVRYEIGLPRALEASVALRWDQIRFRVTDRFVTTTDRDDSGEEGQTAVNPMLGLTWRVRPSLSVYSNLSSAFETPTVTELTTQADGTAGLNAVLKPQRTRTLETGVRGLLGTRTWLDVALFEARSLDELVPFDVPNAPGRRAFRNAGRTSRRGIEASVRTLVGRGDIGVSYTGSRFRFVDYEVSGTRFDGNVVPGIPSHQLQAWSTWRVQRWFVTADVALASSVTVNDAATERADGWTLVGLRGGLENGASIGRWSVAPVFGVENLLDSRYASAVLINATRGRFYEPAAPRTFFAGLRMDVR